MEHKPRCVIVDDDRDFLRFTSCFFSRTWPAFQVIQFISAFEALDFVGRNGVDLVITDFRMPGLDGLKLTAAIRTLDTELPVLVMSGEDIAVEAIASGATDFLPKRSFATSLALALKRVGIGPE